jgi:hypothetical protein
MKTRTAPGEFGRGDSKGFEIENKQWNTSEGRKGPWPWQIIRLIKKGWLSEILYQNPSTLTSDHNANAISGGLSLHIDSDKSLIRHIYATEADHYKQAGEDSSETCESEHPSLGQRYVLFILLCFGGLFLAFGPFMSFNDQRGGWRTYLCGLGVVCCEIGLLFWFMSGLYPYSWGLPPQWLPAKWNPCPQSYRQYFPHGENVSQKL